MASGAQPGINNYSGRYHLDFVRIADPSGQPIDITPLVTEVNINGSIIDPTLVAKININDAQNMLSRLPIKGGSNLTIQVSYSNSSTTYKMVIAEVTSLANFEQQRSYNIIGISNFAFTSGWQKISRAYEGPVSGIAANILQQYGPQESIGLWDQSYGTQTLIIPNWSPIQTMVWLAKRARPQDQLNLFRFFQDMKGKYNFMTVERNIDLYKASPVATFTYFKNVTREVSSNKDERPKTGADTFSIEEIRYGAQGTGDTFNIMEANKDGYFAGKLITTDLYNKVYTEKIYDYFGFYNIKNYANTQPLFKPVNYAPGKIMYNTLAYNSSATGGYNELDDVSYIKRSNIKDYTQRIEITVKGNSVIDLGQLVNVNIPSPSPNIGGDQRDLTWSGNYFIVGQRDKYDRGEKLTILELIKDSMLAGAVL